VNHKTDIRSQKRIFYFIYKAFGVIKSIT